MAEKIFWDTWAFIALAEPNYRYHVEAKTVKAKLDQQRAAIITTQAVLTEVGNAFSSHQKRHLAQSQIRFVSGLESLARAEIIEIDGSLW